METMKQFNIDLKQRLLAAGFTQQEMEVGALTAQVKTALELLGKHVSGNPTMILPMMMLTASVARILAALTDATNIAAERATAASDIIGSAAIDRARAMVGEQPRGEQSGGPLDSAPPANPTDVN